VAPAGSGPPLDAPSLASAVLEGDKVTPMKLTAVALVLALLAAPPTAGGAAEVKSANSGDGLDGDSVGGPVA
jgi:hypothetical protein